VKGLLPYISNDPLFDRDIGKRLGFWEPILARDVKRRIFHEFFRNNQDEKILGNVINYFNAIRARWPTAWDRTGAGNIINRTNGFNAFIRFMRLAYLYCTNEPKVVGKEEYARLFKSVNISDDDFTPQNYLPGTGGSTKLYHQLVDQTKID
jgi:hypothetical protein